MNENLEVKLGDFGQCHKLDYKERRLTLRCGTPNYMAPEVFESREKGYSFSCDVWSLGVTIFKMLVGKSPFDSSDLETTRSLIMKGEFSFPEYPRISDEAKELVIECLHVQTNERITIENVLGLDFFKSNEILESLSPTSLYIELT